jgi:hypothetical protein
MAREKPKSLGLKLKDSCGEGEGAFVASAAGQEEPHEEELILLLFRL